MDVIREFQDLLKARWVQIGALVLLFAGCGYRAMRTMYCVLDPDLWWHLKVGDWILQNHSVPHTGLFSRTAADHSWVAYSWGYETLLSKIFSWFGLMGLGIFGVAITLAVAAVLFWSLLKVSGRFWPAWVLTIAAGSGFLFSIMPRPVFVSMILFSILLAALLTAQRSGELKALYGLPVLFLVWANIHIQFIYGLFTLCLFIGGHLVQPLCNRLFQGTRLEPAADSLPAGRLLAVLGACVVASCVGPYTYHLYQVVLEYSKAKVTYGMIVELLPLQFTSAADFVELFIAAAAACALGWQRKIDLFKIALLAAAVVLAFRTNRDAWFLCIVSAQMIADSFSANTDRHNAAAQVGWRLRAPEFAGAAAAFALCMIFIARITDFNTRELDRAIAGFYPVNACNFLRQAQPPGPLFNSLDWGGFLIWYMPQYPVSLDGRNDLYGDALDTRLYGVETGDLPYSEEPEFARSNLVLLRAVAPLAGLLSFDPAFRMIYRDPIAVIFTRESFTPAGPADTR